MSPPDARHSPRGPKAALLEVRAHDDRLLRKVTPAVAEQIVLNRLGKYVGSNVWLMPGLELSNMRAIRTGLQRLPDLERMLAKDPERYKENWRGTLDAKTGRGAIGVTGGLADAAKVWEGGQPWEERLGSAASGRRVATAQRLASKPARTPAPG